jgi:hypothetical protein
MSRGRADQYVSPACAWGCSPQGWRCNRNSHTPSSADIWVLNRERKEMRNCVWNAVSRPGLWIRIRIRSVGYSIHLWIRIGSVFKDLIDPDPGAAKILKLRKNEPGTYYKIFINFHNWKVTVSDMETTVLIKNFCQRETLTFLIFKKL